MTVPGAEEPAQRRELRRRHAFRNRQRSGSQPVHSVKPSTARLAQFLSVFSFTIGVSPTAASNHGRRSWLALCLSLPSLLVRANCGKRRPPLPPVERVQQRTELLSGVQRGNQVILSWPAPRRNASDASVQSSRRIDGYRLAEKPRAPLGLTEEEFATRSKLIGSVTYDEIKNASEILTYSDTLELAGE